MQLSVFYLPTSSLSARCFRVPVSIREAAFCLATSSLSDCSSGVSDSIPSAEFRLKTSSLYFIYIGPVLTTIPHAGYT